MNKISNWLHREIFWKPFGSFAVLITLGVMGSMITVPLLQKTAGVTQQQSIFWLNVAWAIACLSGGIISFIFLKNISSQVNVTKLTFILAPMIYVIIFAAVLTATR